MPKTVLRLEFKSGETFEVMVANPGDVIENLETNEGLVIKDEPSLVIRFTSSGRVEDDEYYIDSSTAWIRIAEAIRQHARGN